MYGKRLNTKADRAAALNAQSEYLTKSGYSLETYNGLHIFTKIHETAPNVLQVRILKEGAGRPILEKNYKPIEYGRQNVENVKRNHDRQQEYKANRPNQRTGAANTAAAIREELKAAFFGVKFSVKSSNFAGGDSVDVSWTDGPTRDEVEAIVNKYQYGHFNGMEDLYEYSNRREDLPQAKYVQTHRTMSPEAEALILTNCPYLLEREEWDKKRGIYREFVKLSLYTPPAKTEKATAKTEGSTPEEVNVIEYSGKSIAVTGNTYPIKDKLKEIGGKFNKFLSCGAGWVFPKSKTGEVLAMLQSIAESGTEEPQTTQTA